MRERSDFTEPFTFLSLVGSSAMPATAALDEAIESIAHFNLEGEVILESTIRKASGAYSDVFVGSLQQSKLRR